jgi:hypothetical protein
MQYTVNVCGAAPEHPLVRRIKGNPAFSILKHLRCDMQCEPVFHDLGGKRVSLSDVENFLDPTRPARLVAEMRALLLHVPNGSIAIGATCRDVDVVHAYYALPPELRAKFTLDMIPAAAKAPLVRGAPPGFSLDVLQMLTAGTVVDGRRNLIMKGRLLLALPDSAFMQLVVVLPQDQEVVDQYHTLLHDAYKDRVRLAPYTAPLRMRTPAIMKAHGFPQVSLTLKQLFALPADPADLFPDHGEEQPGEEATGTGTGAGAAAHAGPGGEPLTGPGRTAAATPEARP